jgi:hypothetical protein
MAMGSRVYVGLQEFIKSFAQQTAQKPPSGWTVINPFIQQPRPSENDVTITRQLASLHEATDQVLDKLSSLPTKFESALRSESARVLHRDERRRPDPRAVSRR